MKKIGLLFALSLAVFSQSSIAPLRAATHAITNPILFVTQVPIPADFTTIGSVFGNQLADMDSVGRGGDLYIRYPDGTLKNLTNAAGYGSDNSDGFQDDNAIAVRDPSVHWDGTKALFSMVTGAPSEQYDYDDEFLWQMYEITGLGKNQTPVISKIANQPATYNNITPIYGTDGRILFTSDRPHNGAAHLYPQRDEYEEAPTVSGIWSLNPQDGNLFLLNHTPSGAFTPGIDSFGRVIFTRWDHLQRDQQADSDRYSGVGYNSNNCPAYCTFNFESEAVNAARLQTRAEIFPEPRGSDQAQGTNLNTHTFNQFTPWQINEDGTEEETLNHLGRHELNGYIPQSFNDDDNLEEYYGQRARANENDIENFLQVKEDPTTPGRYFGIDAPEFGTHASGQVISVNAAPTVNPDDSVITYWTHPSTRSYGNNPPANHSGHYRDPLPLSGGTLIAAHTAPTDADDNVGSTEEPESRYAFRLKTLKQLANSYWGPDQTLTNGIQKTIWYWSPDYKVRYTNVTMWELQPVEVMARAVPNRRTPQLAEQEQTAISNAGVDVNALKAWMAQNNLALLVARDVTQRDDFDRQQPFNLKVFDAGKQTIGAGGKVYTVKYMQLFQGDMIRGLGGVQDPRSGRRVLAQYMNDTAAMNANKLSPGEKSSVDVAPDGSVAAFVPARRAMTWQTTDDDGVGVVRERMWITFQPGEIRACSSCHGVNANDQAGGPAATNVPAALTELMNYWKTNNGNSPSPTPTKTVTPTRTATSNPNDTPTSTPTATATTNPNHTATLTPSATATTACGSKPAAPELTAPAENATPHKPRVRLKWNASGCATTYQILLRQDSPQGERLVNKKNFTGTRYRTPRLDGGTTYVWRIKACSTGGCSASPWATFRKP